MHKVEDLNTALASKVCATGRLEDLYTPLASKECATGRSVLATGEQSLAKAPLEDLCAPLGDQAIKMHATAKSKSLSVCMGGVCTR